MRILLMNSEYPPVGGGAGNASANIARELAALGQDVCVLTTAYNNLPKDETVDGIRVVRVRALRHRADRSGAFEQGVFIMVAFIGLVRLFARWKPDVILAFFGVPAGVVVMIAKMLYKIPYVVSLRGGDVPGFRPYDFGMYHKLVAPLLRRVWKNAASIVANSIGLRMLAVKFEHRFPIFIIPNGVDVARFTSPADRRWDPPHLLFVGRLVHQKGLDLLFPALGKLTDLPWELTVIGDGPQRGLLEGLAARLSIADRVRFAGWQRGADLDCHYRESNLFILPSRHEGMPNVVLEAMASGLPVLATRIAGSEELVLPGMTGELVAPENKTALEEALRPLLMDASLRRRLGDAGRQRVVTEFTWASVARQYLNLLQSVQEK
jgi:glycosyltransferase involved in cell wall biosynthesis